MEQKKRTKEGNLSMTHDELKERLTQLGATPSQFSSKIFKMTVSVLSAVTVEEAKELYENISADYEKMYNDALTLIEEAERSKAEAEDTFDLAKKIYEEAEIIKSGGGFETAEARDKFRLAHTFKDMAVVQNQYQQTEYTKGLALILGGFRVELPRAE